MTSTHAKKLADEILEDPTKAGPLIRLLYAFKESRNDPMGEVMMQEVLGHCYTYTEHCQEGLKRFVSLAA